MKKELVAIIFLLTILLGCLINIRAVTIISDNLIQMIDEANREAQQENWESSAKYAESALQLWKDKRAYTHFILPHNEIDDAENTLYELLSEIYAQDIGRVSAISKMASAQLEGIASMEQVSLGNIF